MKSCKFLHLIFCFFVFGKSNIYCQEGPDKELLIKYKIIKYIKAIKQAEKGNEKHITYDRTYILNAFGNEESVELNAPKYHHKTEFKYVNDIVLESISEFRYRSNNPISVTLYKYNTNFLLEEELEFDSLDVLISEKRYNKFEKVIEEKTFDPQFDSRTNSTFKYNENNDLIESSQNHKDGITDMYYFYDDRRLLKRHECNWKSNQIWPKYYVYNEANKIKSEHSRRKSLKKDSDGKYIHTFNIEHARIYQYDDNGKLTREKSISNIKEPLDVDDAVGISMDEDLQCVIDLTYFEYDDRGLLSKILQLNNGEEQYIKTFTYFDHH